MRVTVVAALLLATLGCSGEATPIEIRQDLGEVEDVALLEASGLAASRLSPGVLWSHNDSGDRARLFAMTTDGRALGRWVVPGARNVDWEDLAVGPGPEPGRPYLYVGDIGDNREPGDPLVIYRIPEPAIDPEAEPADGVLEGVQALRAQVPGGRFESETLMIDPTDGSLWLATKGDTAVDLLRADAPDADAASITFEPVSTIHFSHVPRRGRWGQGAVGGDIAPSGLAAVIKSYDAVWLWSRTDVSEPLFGDRPRRLPYVLEPQGEAITWAPDGAGYFTLGEERNEIPARIAFYPLIP